jgi:two-component system nitrate/nitrite response regulator NarL
MKVVICDDHRIFSEALSVVLAGRGWTVAGRASDAKETIALVTEHEPDVCLLDVHFPSGSGVDCIGDILDASPDTRVVMLSGSADRETMAKALAAGARGYATKGDDLDNVVDVIARVHDGEVVVRTGRQSAPEQPAAPGSRRGPFAFLTSREREVLEHLVRGQSTAVLADQLNISYATARSHVQNVLMKLGVHSQLQAVAYAVANGFVPSTPDEAPQAQAR